ncbi:MAG: hypothetical protein DRP42_07315 [Tenericutes bacterium]|nr:MAG: hypothetical protein DRP42_07315 [Mycoplasmatota bacterium]
MARMSELLSQFVEETTKKLVDYPDVVHVEAAVSTKNVILQIKTDPKDCGKVIGKKGRTIDALKTITLAIKNTNFPSDVRHVFLEVLEDERKSFVNP